MSVLERFRLDGRRALITGGSRGLGRAMAQAFAEAGADLVLVGREPESLHRAREELKVHGRRVDVIAADLFAPAAVEQMCATALAEHGPVHILVNNVGGRRESIATEQMALADWQRLMDLNL